MGLDLYAGVHDEKCDQGIECQNGWDHFDAKGGHIGIGYISFGVFRHELAKLDGFELDAMWGFQRLWQAHHDEEPWPATQWSEISTMLEPLLNHSDCDGWLSNEQCRAILPRLRQLVTGLSERWSQFGANLADLVSQCVENEWWVLFA